jgi:hypothetical protein
LVLFLRIFFCSTPQSPKQLSDSAHSNARFDIRRWIGGISSPAGDALLCSAYCLLLMVVAASARHSRAPSVFFTAQLAADFQTHTHVFSGRKVCRLAVHYAKLRYGSDADYWSWSPTTANVYRIRPVASRSVPLACVVLVRCACFVLRARAAPRRRPGAGGAGGIVAASAAAAGRGFDSGRGLVVSRIPEGRERAQR